QLADRYISDRFLPDKAIDLIDEAGSRMRIRRMYTEGDPREDEGNVTEEIVAEVLATATGIPVFKLTEEESQRLLRMEDELHKRIIGQDDAIKGLSRAIRRTRAGLKDPRRPGGSFIFAGPSGVGKTELSKALAEFLFGDEDALIMLDMSEFMEKHTVSRLFGSPPGYVGYEEGGQLTEKVRRKPFSVVLFDEIEKAHGDIFNSLLQVLEDGRLTDAQGRVVDFKNTVIIMTTNLGSRVISKSVSLGFSTMDDSDSMHNRMKSQVQEELKQHFRPEFLNRIDDIVVFHQLTQKEIIQIVDLMLAGLAVRLRDRDMDLEVTAEAKALLAERGYDPVLGARPLRRTIQRELEDTLSEKILYGDLRPGHIVKIAAEGDVLTFTGAERPLIPEPPAPPAAEPGAAAELEPTRT
ncbi:AAA family ATPase, partial [Sphaerisporangium aureirubrum]